MKIKHYLFYAFLLACACACQKEEVPTFKDVSRIQFGFASTIGEEGDPSIADSLQTFSFVYHPSSVVTDTVYFNIFTTGGPASEDRYYTLKQIELEGANNAKPGVHYLPFNEENTRALQVIKAGQVEAQCGIVLLRDTSLQKQEVTLFFELLPTNDFQLGEEEFTRRKLVFSDQLIEPKNWKGFGFDNDFAFGKYSKVKHRFMIDVTGEEWDDELLQYLFFDFGEMLYFKSFLSLELVKYNNEHPGAPLKDEDGDLVIF